MKPAPRPPPPPPPRRPERLLEKARAELVAARASVERINARLSRLVVLSTR
jgi:hypothetical protein